MGDVAVGIKSLKRGADGKTTRFLRRENGRPIGKDEEYWLKAEREFREAVALAKETLIRSRG
jgi:hypothetical protein